MLSNKGWTEAAAVPIEQAPQEPAKQSHAMAGQTATAKPTNPRIALKTKPKTKANTGCVLFHRATSNSSIRRSNP